MWFTRPNLKIVADTYNPQYGPMEATPNTSTAQCGWWGRSLLQITADVIYGEWINIYKNIKIILVIFHQIGNYR